MRDIKFRGKSLESGEWLYGSLINNVFYEFDLKKPCFYIIDSDKYNIDDWCDFADWADDMEVYDNTVDEYTGLKDKFGAKIFTNDILKFGYMNVCTIFNEKEARYNVYALVKGGRIEMNIDILKAQDAEILGNVYDNPELLQEGQR